LFAVFLIALSGHGWAQSYSSYNHIPDKVLQPDGSIISIIGGTTWAVAGIDDSAYQDGYSIIAIYDAAGIGAFGYYKSGGSGAVVSTKAGATQNWTYIGAGFSTYGNFTRKVLYVGN
jgi:hypothetical protein